MAEPTQERGPLGEGLYADLINSLNGIVWEADGRTFQFTFVSPQAERILGYPAEQWLAEPGFWVNHTHPDDVGWCTAFCIDATAHRRDHQFEYRMIHRNGQTVWLRDAVSVRGYEDGSVRLWGVMLDITQSRLDEANLADRLRFESLVTELSSAFTLNVTVDVHADIEYWLQRLAEFLGVERATLLIFSDDQRSLTRSDSWTAPGLEPLWPGQVHTEFPWITKQLREGRVVKLVRGPGDFPPEASQERAFSERMGVKSALNIPVMMGSRAICALSFTSLGAYRDYPEDLINRLRLAGEIFANAIQRQHVTKERDRLVARLRTVVSASTHVVWVADAEGTAREMSDWCELTGQTAEAAQGWGWMDAVHPDDRERVASASAAGIDARRPFNLEYRIRIADGSFRTFACSRVPVLDDAGALREWVGTCSDVTEHRKLEEQLVQSQKMEAIGRLAGGVAHDFNNLLTVINGYGEVLADSGELSRDGGELVGEMRRAGEHAAALTRQLLAFSRKQVMAPRVVDLNDTVRSIEKMLRRLIGEDIELATSLAPDLKAVLADPGQVEQVLMNLAVNARDAMPEGGRLMLRTVNARSDRGYQQVHPELPPGGFVILSVEDTGSGMSEEVRRHAFEPFYTTKPAGQGTGLGLATVYGIVRQSGGLIELLSEPGLGTTFKVYLPTAPRAGVPASEPPAGNQARAPGGKESVLLVEDEDAVRALTRRVLERSGYSVLEARNGREGLRLAAETTEPICLLITDVVMPEMGGGELARKLQAARKGLKVLYLSGYTDDAIIRHGIMGNEVAFLQKPFTLDGFLAKVRETIDRKD